MNKRLEMAVDLLGERHFHRLLDAGYGGGVFFPELARRSEELYGIDIHPYRAQVERMAAAEGVEVFLQQASLSDTGFPDGHFDGIVCISVLEFVSNLSGAITEMCRIAAPKATIILGFPGENMFTRVGYFLARTPDPREVHVANHRVILAEVHRHLKPVRLLQFPSFLPPRCTLFFVGEFERP